MAQDTFANESTAVRTGPIESVQNTERIAAIKLRQKRDQIRKEMNNLNLSDEEVDNIIYVRENPEQPAQLQSHIIHRDAYGRPLSKSQIEQNTQQHQEQTQEVINRNNGLRHFGYSTLTDKQAEQNPRLVSQLERNAAGDVTAKGLAMTAFIPGMQWLRGFSAPLYYGVNAGLTGASAYDLYKNGPNFWNVTGTIGGGLDLSIPVALKGYQSYQLNKALNQALATPRTFGTPITTELIHTPKNSRISIIPRQEQREIIKLGDLDLNSNNFYHQASGISTTFNPNTEQGRWFSKGYLFNNNTDDVIELLNPDKIKLQYNGEYQQVAPILESEIRRYRYTPDQGYKLDNRTKYIELLGKTKDAGKFEGQINDRSPVTRPFADYLESLGIDSSIFTEQDLNRLMEMRSKSVQSSISQTGRSAITYETKPKNQQTIFSIDINENGNFLGEIQARSHVPNHPRSNEVPIDIIQRIESPSSKGFSEDAYNAAINYIQQTNMGEGIVSGDRLLSPEITYRVWEHYPNKKLLRTTGHHSFGTGRDVVGAPVSETHEGPIVMLTEPSKLPVPMKSNHIFHPDMIRNGTLLPPDWTKHSMYYSLPLLLGLNGMYSNKETNY